jgi:hypothetical protein
VRSNVYDNVPVAQAGRPFPVLLFSHGLGNSPFIYAIQLEDLASHGYVIVATSHIGDAVAVVLPGGVSVPFAPWTSSDSSAAGVHRRLFVDDLVLALDQMTVLSRDAGSPFNGVLDLSRIGSFGHSIGGRAAVGACMKDSRIRACLNQDGGLHGPNEQGTSFPGTFAWLDWFDPGLDAEDYAAVGTTPYNYARDLLRPLETDLKIWRQHEGGSLRLTLLKKGMAHTAFTDMRWLTATSDASRARFLDYLTRIRQVTRAFFDQALYGRSSALLNCTPSESDLLVQCYRPEPTQKP